MSLIDLNNIIYRYPGEKDDALKYINISIEQGEMLLIIGASGSGKTTLGKLFTGAVPHFYGGTLQGEVKLEGQNLMDMDRNKRASKITMVFQDPERQIFMNKVHREIAQGLENIGVKSESIAKRVWEAMEFTGISHLAYRDTSSLSGGEKQKLSIASAIAYQPQCIVLDEPTSQLDPSSAEEVFNLLYRINQELGITIIIIEQRVDLPLEKMDRILFMEEGKEKFLGTPQEFYKANMKDYLSSALRLSKKLEFSIMPSSIKEIRKVVQGLDIKQYEEIEEVSENERILTVENLKVKLEDNEILKGISLGLNNRDFVSIMGPNGAGKTTFIKALCGLNKYDGSIKLFGKEVKKLKSKDIVSHIGYVSQNPNDYISKDTVYEEVKFTLDNFKIEDGGKVQYILEKLDLMNLKDKNPRDLSGGEKQRVALASVMVMKPQILILDEPTRGIDPILKRRLGEFLKELNEDGLTILLVTHDMDFAAEYCKKHMLMFSGKVVSYGSLKEVMGQNIYYTTSINKIFRGVKEDIFTINQLERN